MHKLGYLVCCACGRRDLIRKYFKEGLLGDENNLASPEESEGRLFSQEITGLLKKSGNSFDMFDEERLHVVEEFETGGSD